MSIANLLNGADSIPVGCQFVRKLLFTTAHCDGNGSSAVGDGDAKKAEKKSDGNGSSAGSHGDAKKAEKKSDGNGSSAGSHGDAKKAEKKPEGSVKFASPKYFALCGLGGVVSCGLTHTFVVPLDLVKCRLQVDPEKYRNIAHGFRVTVNEGGYKGLARGWLPTLLGYSVQGLGKFGLYEIFKVYYSQLIGEEYSYLYRTSLYLCASASAEFFADIGLSPFEAMKVRIQTAPGFTSSMTECASIIYKQEGLTGFYKSIVPLWGRQIPYTMMKFACFERTLEALYKYVVPKPRELCSKAEQLGVTFVAGYIAGVFCAIVSHPADTIVSKLNKDKGSTAMDVAKKLGWAGMWKGLTLRIIMIGTLTALQWFIYDGVKVALDLPRPPPPSMPESLKKKLEGQGKD